ncbi:hypothetical protein Corgl_0595 [Coriobacterium glomerans PW2]|uniref:Methyltransferase type 12 n=1 Tax=Coriobacterium glomerans (strain ATCC 49209 / DSM 20642 / JCM 10262 / PW2) TaxID=700015 RepID=F2NBH3_CORGP|nr:class I SAM-dependent methyltransferase [Coriobacterium glomerans]AEB06709.1 hypothetical protein Corgl_0595 [Coriobacterium glomerans PW2]
MDDATARALISLDNAFYREHAKSFSATRQAPWPGWRRLIELIEEDLSLRAAGASLSVFDLACGNLRFERYLREELPSADLTFHAWDSCTQLARVTAETPRVDFVRIDVLDALMNPSCAPCCTVAGPTCDLTVCFGFMHHVPGMRLREAVIDLLIERTRPGGIIAVSLWHPLSSARIRRRARACIEAARTQPPFAGYRAESMDEGDLLLGWDTDLGPRRFCHHFSQEDIAALTCDLARRGAILRHRFTADGRQGDLNTYLVLERCRAVSHRCPRSE